MTVPGSNLLRQALRMIGSQTVDYYKDAGRTTSRTGRDVTAYEKPVTITEGSVQAVPLRNYAYLGLDLKRNYINWFVPADVVGLDRGRSGDQIVWNGRRYSIEGQTPWNAMDGWVECLCVEIADDAG